MLIRSLGPVAPPSAPSRPAASPAAAAPAEAPLPEDRCTLQARPPTRLKPDYLWEGTPLPGPLNVVLRFAVNTLGLGRRMGLEPAPARDPEPKPLAFAWNATPDFPTHARALEAQLKHGQEVGKKRLGGGRNGSFLVELSTGPCGVWKPRAYELKEKSRTQLPKDANQALRDVAAYQVDAFLGHMVRVPPAVASGLEGREGALSLFVPGCADGRDLGEKPVVLGALSEQDYRRLALFDHVIGNLDRHGGNWLVDREGHPVPIDHGLSFPLQNRDQGFHHFDFDRSFALNDEEKARLNSFLLRRGEIRDALGPLLEKEAIEAMFERVEHLLTEGRTSSWWRT